jgi:hypothetical protein
LLLGLIDSGKTTTVQYLYGANMVKDKYDNIQARPIPKKLKSFIVDQSISRKFRYYNINPIEFDYKNSEGDI